MHTIATTAELAAACAELARQPYVAVDTEFLREQTYYSELCLVQIAAPGFEAIVDPLAKDIDLGPFWELMAHEPVVKVFHAGRQDIEIVWNRARVIPTPVFDTQVAAMVCGFGESISYVNLVREIAGVDLDKSSRFTDWSRRPLSDKQLAYALADVTHLREVYTTLKGQLEASGRGGWLEEEMAELVDPATYETKPQEAWRRLKIRIKSRKALGVLIELAAWREEQAQRQNVPRARVLKDDVLYDLANQMPTEVARLADMRSLSDGFSRSAKAREIVEVVRRGLGRDAGSVPAVPAGTGLAASQQALADMLRVLLKAAAARNKVAPRLIASADDLDRIASEREPDVPALKGWRRDLFGEDALRLKRGEIAITVLEGEVVVLPTARRG
jgi:ribonuclease D